MGKEVNLLEEICDDGVLGILQEALTPPLHVWGRPLVLLECNLAVDELGRATVKPLGVADGFWIVERLDQPLISALLGCHRHLQDVVHRAPATSGAGVRTLGEKLVFNLEGHTAV